MAYSRQFGVIGILGVCFFVAVGCDDSDDKKVNDDAEAGENAGGSAGSGGKSTGGSQSTAGKGGKATGGTAGSATAGTVNGGGEGGGAGEGVGGVGGVGGEGDTGPALGGAGADGGGGESGGGAGGAPAALTKCSYSCVIEADCQMADAPPLHCDETTKRCVDPRQVCDADDDCASYLSNWSGSACEDDTGCSEGVEACVEWQGVGQCATLADTNNPEFPCTFGNPGSLPRFGAEGDADICITPDPRCIDGACQPGCGDLFSGGCGIGNGDTCSELTGLCECAEGTECDSGACGADGHCACVTSEDCTVPGRDTCQDGICVCGSAESCPNPGFVNAPAVCE